MGIFVAKIGMTNIPYREPDPERLAKAVSGLKTANDLYRQVEDAQRENAASQRKQDRKNLIFFIIGTVIAIYSVYLTWKGNESNKTIDELTNHVDSITVRLNEATRQVLELEQRMNSGQHKNDSMRTIGEEMNEVLKRNGASD